MGSFLSIEEENNHEIKIWGHEKLGKRLDTYNARYDYFNPLKKKKNIKI